MVTSFIMSGDSPQDSVDPNQPVVYPDYVVEYKSTEPSPLDELQNVYREITATDHVNAHLLASVAQNFPSSKLVGDKSDDEDDVDWQ